VLQRFHHRFPLNRREFYSAQGRRIHLTQPVSLPYHIKYYTKSSQGAGKMCNTL
jgi:hypothetical protein